VLRGASRREQPGATLDATLEESMLIVAGEIEI
jgi:hypothetical protein